MQHPHPTLPMQSLVSWKKTKQDLLSKHVHFTGTGAREIQLYRCLSIAPDDVLAWWKSHKNLPQVVIARQNNNNWPFQLPVPHPNEFFPQRD